jgi:transcriptional regulator with XRE-family HTH domain
MTDKKSAYREALGGRLRAFRKDRGMTAYRVAVNGGIRIDQVKSIESGEANYTVDSLIGYALGSDLRMCFAEKSGDSKKPHGHDDMIGCGIDAYPEVIKESGREGGELEGKLGK